MVYVLIKKLFIEFDGFGVGIRDGLEAPQLGALDHATILSPARARVPKRERLKPGPEIVEARIVGLKD